MTPFEEIPAKVASVLAKSLGVDEDDVIPSATLQGDLGAESIDFLDIVFRMEREFAITIPRGELFPEDVLGDSQGLLRDGRLTDLGLAALRARMPFADLRTLERDRRLGKLEELFTIDLLVSYVRWKLQGGTVEPNAETTACYSPDPIGG
jgi:acyl carrier protein